MPASSLSQISGSRQISNYPSSNSPLRTHNRRLVRQRAFQTNQTLLTPLLPLRHTASITIRRSAHHVHDRGFHSADAFVPIGRLSTCAAALSLSLGTCLTHVLPQIRFSLFPLSRSSLILPHLHTSVPLALPTTSESLHHPHPINHSITIVTRIARLFVR